MGKVLMIVGLLLALAGLVIQFAPQALSWFGKLPGDFRYEKENFKIFFPLTTMIIVSVLLTVVIRLLGK